MRNNLVMVALRSEGPIDWEAIVEASGGEPSEEAANKDGDGFEAVTFSIPDGSVGLAHMPMPIPWGDLEWPVRTAWHWPEAESELRTHTAHVVVFVSSDQLSDVELNLQLVKVVAGVVAACPGAIGVYNGNASVVIEANQYVEEAKEASPENLPILLWLGLHLVSDDGGLSAYTTGMEVFQLLNLEAHDTAMAPPSLLNLLINIAHYEIGAGIQIDDGETVGATAEEKIDVRHRPSRFGQGAVTCQLILPRTTQIS